MAAIDLTTMLYLNPELAAYSNITTLSAADTFWTQQGNQQAHLQIGLPTTPVGFDPKVYVAAQHDVSPLNQTIYASMTNMGIGSNSMMRRGEYVSTIMADVALAYSSNSGGRIGLELSAYDIANEPLRFTSSNLNSGDHVRLQRHTDGRGTSGVPLYGQVVSVTSGTFFVLNPTSPAAFNSDPVGCTYVLSGIRIWDVERQARVSYARNSAAFANALSNSGGNTSNMSSFPGYVDPDDVVPRPDFNLDAYRSVYPDVKLLDFSDAYLDYRLRWKRADQYRLVNNRYILNLEAPYASNLTTGGGGGGYGLTGYNASFSNNLTVYGHLGIGMACTGSEGFSAEIDAWHGGSSNWWASAGSNTRLAVAGDIFATGTVISLSDSRVKSCVQPIENALGRLSFLTGYTYDVNGSTKRQTGLLAQDVAKVLPEAVFYRSSEGILNGEPGPVASVAYGNLAGLFVNAINELADRISKIEQRLGPI